MNKAIQVFDVSEFENSPGLTTHTQFKEFERAFIELLSAVNEQSLRISSLVNQIKFVGRAIHDIKNEHNELRRAYAQLEKRLVEPEFKLASEL